MQMIGSKIQSNSARLDQINNGSQTLLYVTAKSDPGTTRLSWRTPLEVVPERYRFEGKVKAVGFQQTMVGDSAGLRITRVFLGLGRYRCEDVVPRCVAAVKASQRSENISSQWQTVSVDFEVQPPAGIELQQIEFICELRTADGEPWFDAGFLRLRKL